MEIEHLAIYVNDIELVKDFFVRYFDATANEMYHNKQSDFKSYFLNFESGSRLGIRTRPGLLDRPQEQLRCGIII